MNEYAIQTFGLGKRFRLGTRRGGRGLHKFFDDLVRRVVPGLPPGHGEGPTELRALRDLDLSIRHGELVGLIGHNGAGKSVLLKLLSRVTFPTEGYALVDGKVGSMLEVGAGFHPEFSGRENLFLAGAILGMSIREVRAKFDEIVEFAEIEDFLDTPVKRYSSGLYVRLAFAVAAHLDTRIMLFDEVLSVGDEEFREKCMARVQQMTEEEGRTVVFVSHDLPAVERLCPRTIVLEAGCKVFDGPTAGALECARALHHA